MDTLWTFSVVVEAKNSFLVSLLCDVEGPQWTRMTWPDDEEGVEMERAGEGGCAPGESLLRCGP